MWWVATNSLPWSCTVENICQLWSVFLLGRFEWILCRTLEQPCTERSQSRGHSIQFRGEGLPFSSRTKKYIIIKERTSLCSQMHHGKNHPSCASGVAYFQGKMILSRFENGIAALRRGSWSNSNLSGNSNRQENGMEEDICALRCPAYHPRHFAPVTSPWDCKTMMLNICHHLSTFWFLWVYLDS